MYDEARVKTRRMLIERRTDPPIICAVQVRRFEESSNKAHLPEPLVEYHEKQAVETEH